MTFKETLSGLSDLNRQIFSIAYIETEINVNEIFPSVKP